MQSKKILLVEDEEALADLAVFLLTRHGYRVHYANNGLMALDLLEKHHFDLVITDIKMPGMTGAELCLAIRSRPGLSATPILGFSSVPEEAVRTELVKFDGYVQKPFLIAALLEQVRRLIETRESA